MEAKYEKVNQLGNVMFSNNRENPNQGRVYDAEYIAPTLTNMQGGGRQPHIIEVTKMETNILGNLQPDKPHQSTNVYDENGVAPNIMAGTHGYGMGNICEQQIVAMRGRNPENPSDRTAGMHLEQKLEPNSEGICNTLTSVQKDNLVMETREIEVLGNYMPSEHDASRVVSVGGGYLQQ